MIAIARFHAEAIAIGLVLAAAGACRAYSPDTVRSAMQPLLIGTQADYPVSVLDYFHYYGLDFPGITHAFGSYQSDSFVLAAHVFLPEHSRGTLLAVHGYYDHAGIMRTIIRQALDSGYAVAAIDLPGHGLSSGKRSSIGDFAQYGRAIGDFLNRYRAGLPGPLLLAGHSTGCAAIMEYLHESGGQEVTRVILVAPLVRPVFWKLSRAGYRLSSKWLTETNRWFRNSSSDKAWKQWYRGDPLQEKAFPVEWAVALYVWNSRFETYTPFAVPVVIIQGCKDETVDWRYNMKFLKTKCRNLKIHLIKRGRHQLANEGGPVREEFIRIFGSALTG